MSIISEKLENIRNYLDVEVHSVVSPDRWDVYAALCDMVDDIIALLKAQEPRVVTWDELIATDHVYIETNKDGQKYIVPGIVTIVRDTAVIISVRIGTRLIDCTIDKDVYGIEYRCWTSRPDEKRRAETLWK